MMKALDKTVVLNEMLPKCDMVDDEYFYEVSGGSVKLKHGTKNYYYSEFEFQFDSNYSLRKILGLIALKWDFLEKYYISSVNEITEDYKDEELSGETRYYLNFKIWMIEKIIQDINRNKRAIIDLAQSL